MLAWKKLLKIGIISLLLPLNPLPGNAIAQTQTIQVPKQTFLTNALIAATENQKRTALVIGNSNYQKAVQLVNPVNDATDMAQALEKLGFDVIVLKNANLRQMGEALDKFHAELRRGGVGAFYYAGHGIQVDGENYLIPIDAKLTREQDIAYEALPLGKILGAMEDAANDVNIVILDACRDNPFSRRWQRSTQAQGLAPVQAVRGSYIAYATAPGDVASDGEGRNGIFTAQILKHIKTPNLDVEDMFKLVRQDVLQATNNQQMPWDSSSLVGEFSFNSNSTPVATSSPAPESNNSTPVATSTPVPESTTPVETSTPAPETTTPPSNPQQDSAEELAQQGDDQHSRGDYLGAIDILSQALALNPNDANAYNNRAAAYRELYEYQQALPDVNKAIQLNPNFADAYWNRALIYSGLDNWENALADFKKAAELFCQQGDSFYCKETRKIIRLIER
jgi:tetratricopeptide (TPR) repeat protein